MARPISGKKPKNFWFTLKTLLSYMGRHKFLFLAVAVLVTLSALGNLLGTYMIRPVVNSVGAGDINALARGVILTAVIFAIGALAAFGYTQTMVYAAQKVLNGYHVDKAVFSCKGIDMKDGITDSNELDSDIKNAMYACADTAILAVDSSKFDHVSFVKSMRLKKGDILVTDRKPSEDWQNYLQEQGVRLVTP